MSEFDNSGTERLAVTQEISGNNHQIAGQNIYNHFDSHQLSINSLPEELNEHKRIAKNLIAGARKRLFINKANLFLIIGLVGFVAYAFSGFSLLPSQYNKIEFFLVIGYAIALIGLPTHFIWLCHR